jgi:hypothetical protein
MLEWKWKWKWKIWVNVCVHFWVKDRYMLYRLTDSLRKGALVVYFLQDNMSHLFELQKRLDIFKHEETYVGDGNGTYE